MVIRNFMYHECERSCESLSSRCVEEVKRAFTNQTVTILREQMLGELIAKLRTLMQTEPERAKIRELLC
jgi:hypothetical protein